MLRLSLLLLAALGPAPSAQTGPAAPADALDARVDAEMATAAALASDAEFEAAYQAMLSYSALRDRQLARERQAALDAQREAMAADERRRTAEVEAAGARRQRTLLVACTAVALLLAVAVAALLRGRRRLRRTNDLLAVERDAKQALAQEREVLVREVHHRVKGNLQVVTSLLNLQIRTLGGRDADPAAVDPLRQTQWRVEAIALAHEQLHQSESLREIDAEAYLGRLLGALADGAGGNGVDLRVEVEPVPLDTERAVSLGLAVAELVGNVYKHAHPAGGAGAAVVRLERAGPGRARLVVEDDGRGLPADLDEAGSLGVRLVRDLAAQLDGTLRLGPTESGGARAELTFPLPPTDGGSSPAPVALRPGAESG